MSDTATLSSKFQISIPLSTIEPSKIYMFTLGSGLID